MSKKAYDEKKIAEAKGKLACHIGDPGAVQSDNKHEDKSSASVKNKEAQRDFIDETGKVLLTRMTAAGG